MTVFNLAIELAYWQQTVIRSVLALVAVLLPAGTLVYLYLFKSSMDKEVTKTENNYSFFFGMLVQQLY